MKRALASGLVRRKRSTQTRVSSHRTGTSRNWEATVYAVFRPRVTVTITIQTWPSPNAHSRKVAVLCHH